jgi:hypothetical protein
VRVERGVFSQIPTVASSPVASGKIQIFHRRAPRRRTSATETGLGATLPRTIIPALFSSSVLLHPLSKNSQSTSSARLARLLFSVRAGRLPLRGEPCRKIALRLRSLISLALRFPFPTVIHGDSFVRRLPARRPAASRYSMALLPQPRLASRLSRAWHPLFVRGPSGRRSPSGPRANRMAVVQARMLGRSARDVARND